MTKMLYQICPFKYENFHTHYTRVHFSNIFDNKNKMRKLQCRNISQQLFTKINDQSKRIFPHQFYDKFKFIY